MSLHVPSPDHPLRTSGRTGRNRAPAALSRRGLLGFGAAVALGLPLARPAAAREPEPERAVRVHNCQTGESFEGVYWAEGRPLAEALARIDWVLRDHRNDHCRPIDLALLHRLSAIQERLESDRPFEVLSGFRSPESNRQLIAQGASVHSLHLEGRAADLRLPGTPAATLYRCVLSFGNGGVGCYPERGFVHVDTGPTRRWVGG